jgi:hypothetical protein
MAAFAELSHIHRAREGKITGLIHLERHRLSPSCPKIAQYPYQELRAFALRSNDDAVKRVPRLDGKTLRRQHITCVDLFCHSVHRDGRCRLTSQHLPERGHHAAIGREPPAVHVDAAEPRQGEKLGLENFRRRH